MDMKALLCVCFASAAPAGVRSELARSVSVTVQTGVTSASASSCHRLDSVGSLTEDGKVKSVAAIFGGLGSCLIVKQTVCLINYFIALNRYQQIL